ncbi:MAG: 1-(5-phosphoribosyl)-5-[(5-phosphoribosylamino)methylideneamino]imidazole-4-carboxamide isomerase [Elusimicrobia bacterium]|nr:1-(5-phosphoribosyl)-5-[(5-phosphoribosylamino)methylideneamino]imidazole-4-carboxamide isomerase [Elusimicrobiota bacterium]
MLVIPAVDIKGGNCVRLSQGKAADEIIYSSDPVKIAKRWENEGAERVHIIDLDGAFEGRPVNSSQIVQIAEELSVPIQVGGGIRDIDTASFLLDAGVAKIIIGTSAVQNLDFLRKLIKKYPQRIIAGIDAKNGRVAISAWTDVTDLCAIDFARRMEDEGVDEIIITDISRDGMLTGPNLEWIREMSESVGMGVISAGGVSSPEDIRNLLNLQLPNLRGAIVGKAMFSTSDFLEKSLEITKGKK